MESAKQRRKAPALHRTGYPKDRRRGRGARCACPTINALSSTLLGRFRRYHLLNAGAEIEWFMVPLRPPPSGGRVWAEPPAPPELPALLLRLKVVPGPELNPLAASSSTLETDLSILMSSLRTLLVLALATPSSCVQGWRRTDRRCRNTRVGGKKYDTIFAVEDGETREQGLLGFDRCYILRVCLVRRLRTSTFCRVSISAYSSRTLAHHAGHPGGNFVRSSVRGQRSFPNSNSAKHTIGNTGIAFSRCGENSCGCDVPRYSRLCSAQGAGSFDLAPLVERSNSLTGHRT